MSQSIQIQVTQVGLEQSIAAAMKRVGSSAQINLGTNSRQINALSQPLGRITGQADEFTKSMAAANARVLAFGASAGIIAGVSKAMSGLVTSTIKVEKSLTEINSVLNKSGAELDKFGQQIFNVAKNTGKSFDEVASGALELARQGLSAEDTLARLNDALILSRLSGLDAAQSVEGLTAAFNSFQKSGITTAEILNKVVAVSQKYAVSERDIIEGVKRSASVAQQAGVSFDELAAVITAVQQTTARGGAVIGNSFKTIFARIQRKDVLSDLQNMGVAVTDLQGNVLPALRILENLAGQLQNFSQIEQANIAEKLGGVFQLDKLLSALKDLSSEASVTRGALKAAGEAGNSAYEKNIVLNQTLAALLNKVAVNAEQLGAKLGEIGVTDSLKNVLGFFNNLLEGIQKVLGEESGLGNLVRGLVKGLGSFLAGPGLALFGAIILKLSKDLVQFGFASLKAFFGIGKAAKEVQNVEGAISQILAKNVNLQQQLFALEGNRAAQLRVITAALVEQEALLRRSASISSGLAAPLYNVGARATGSGLRVGNSADGYMPAVAKESKAIKQGVGGARSGDKPVVMPNFNFGGGKKGTMVAHTGEYIVPNFSGSGGTAVFNRQMVQSMGLPSGAKKINAAGGLIPNFANVVKKDNLVKYTNYPVQEVLSKKGSLQQINKVDTIDQFSGLVEIIHQKRNDSEYNKATNKIISQFWNKENEDGDNEKLNRILSSMQKKGVDPQYLTRIRTSYGNRNYDYLRKQFKGALGELDAKNLSGQQLASGNAYMDLVGGGEVKTTLRTPFSGIASKIMNSYLLTGPNLKNITKNGKPKLDRVNAKKLPIYMPIGGTIDLNAASGFIPNFAPKFNAETVRKYANEIEKYKLPTKDFYQFPDGTGGYGSQIKNVLSRTQSKAVANQQIKEKKIEDKGFFNLNADALGGILLVSPRFGKGQGSLDTSMQIGEIPFFNQDKSPPIDKNKYIKLAGIKTSNTPSGRDLKSLRADVNELFSDGIVKLAYRLYGETFDPASGGEFSSKLQSLDASRKQQLLPPAAQGDLFEAAGKVALNSFANLESLFGSGEQNRPFDFQNPEALRKVFGVNAKRGEAKRGGEKNFSSSKQVQGIIKKIFNDSEYGSSAVKSLRSQGAFDLSKAQKAANAAGGFIPNFVSKSREIGSGIQGTFYRLGNKDGVEVGVKKFVKDGFSQAAQAEWLVAEYLSKYVKIPAVFGPKNLSKLQDSIRKKAIRKEVVSDQLARNAVGGDVARMFGSTVLFNALKTQGLSIGDLHGSNYTVNESAAKAIRELKNYPQDAAGALSVLKQMASKGARIGIIDAGLTKVSDPARSIIGSILQKESQQTATAAGGFLPNFARPLQAAVNREMAAGVPASQIYIDKSPALKNAANPMGLMVANRRDEPAGGFQGINRARREGANPMMYGAADGFIPNYAAGASGPDLSPYAGQTVPQATAQIQKELEQTLKAISTEYKKQLAELTSSQRSLKQKNDLEKQLLKAVEAELKQANLDLQNATKKGSKESIANIAILRDRQIQKQKEFDSIQSQQLATEKQILDKAKRIDAAQKLRESKIKKEAEARTNSQNIQAAVSQSAKRSITNPMGKVKDASATPGGNRDMLGTIFAVQGAMSALTGATEDATGGLGQFTNGIASAASSASTALFATQGLSQAFGGAEKGVGKFLGKLGPYGAAAAFAYTGFQEFAKYIDKTNPEIQKASEAMSRVSDAASKAAINLNNINPATKARFEKESETSLAMVGLLSESQRTTSRSASQGLTNILAGLGSFKLRKTDVVAGLGDQLQNDVLSTMSQARGVGMTRESINEILLKYAKEGELNYAGETQITAQEAEQAINEIRTRVNRIADKASPEGALSSLSQEDQKQLQLLTSENVETVLKNTGKISEARSSGDAGALERLMAMTGAKQLTEIRDTLFNAGVEDVNVLDDYIRQVFDLGQARKKQEEEARKESEKTYQTNLGKIQAEIKLDEKLNAQKKAIFSQEQAQKESLAQIENDISVSENDRSKAIAAINKSYGQAIALLTEQEQKTKNIGDAIIGGLTGVPGIVADQIAGFAEKISGKLPEFDINNITEYQNKLTQVFKEIELPQAAIKPLLEALTEAEKTNKAVSDEREKQIAILEKEYGIQIKTINATSDKLSLEKQISAQIEARNSEASFKIENRVLNNAYETLSINKEIERIKRETSLNELQKAEQVYQLELKRRGLESTGIGIGLEQNLLNIDQELINKAREAIKSSGKISADQLKSNLTIEDLQSLASVDVGASEEIKVAIANAQRQRDLAQKRASNEQASLGDVVPDDAITRASEGFFGGMKRGVAALENQTNIFASTLGEKIPQMFSDNMSNAINKMIEGGESFGNILQGAAYEFVKGINQANIQNLSNKFSNFLFKSDGGTGGGGIASFFSNMFASGGKVTGGSGSKDDVPAMLMGGEYVVNKRAVAKYGPQFLEAINNGTLAGYAKGGTVQRGPQGNFYTPGTFGQGAISGKRNLLDFATQSGTSGKFDQIINESGYQAISLEPESSRLSVSGMRNSPMFEATQSAKGQAFDLYLQQYNAEKEAKKQEKAQKKALTTQLLMLAGSAVLGGIGKAAMTGGTNAVKALGQGAGFFDKTKAFFGGTYKGGDIGGGIMGGGLKNLFSGNFGLAYQSEILKASPISSIAKGIARSNRGVAFKGNTINTQRLINQDPLPSVYTPIDISDEELGLLLPPVGGSNSMKIEPVPKKAIGGMIPSTSGIDTVPAMLSGGEFVMNRSAVQSIGAPNLQSMNAGGTSITSEETSKELNEKLLAKLDELIKVSDSSAAGNITINVAPSGQTTQEGSQDASANRQQLARQIKDAVLQVINDEKRIGGSLRR